MTSAFSYWDTGLVRFRDVSLPNNNAGGVGRDWDDASYADISGGGIPQIRPLGQYERVDVGRGETKVASLMAQGAAGANAVKSGDNPLKVSFSDAHLNVTATVTLLHRRSGEDLNSHAGGTRLHGRVLCTIKLAPASAPDSYTQVVGTPAWASSGEVSGAPSGSVVRDHELVNVSINGTVSGLQPGAQYNVAVFCNDADYTGQPQWQLAQSNLTALASR